MKTKAEQNALKAKADELRRELSKLTDEELAQVLGGTTGYETGIISVNGTDRATDDQTMKATTDEACGAATKNAITNMSYVNGSGWREFTIK